MTTVWLDRDACIGYLKEPKRGYFDKDVINGELKAGDTFFMVEIQYHHYDSFNHDPSQTSTLMLTSNPVGLADFVDAIDEYLTDYVDEKDHPLIKDGEQVEFDNHTIYIGNYKGWGTSYEDIRIVKFTTL